MAKKVTGFIKLQLPAGAATPAPPVGPALGQHGVNIMQFVKAYNELTAAQSGTIIPVEITVYQDRSFTFITNPQLLNAKDFDSAMKILARTGKRTATQLKPAIAESASVTAEKQASLDETTKALRDYQKSEAFTNDLLAAFKGASRQAEEENERLGISDLSVVSA